MRTNRMLKCKTMLKTNTDVLIDYDICIYLNFLLTVLFSCIVFCFQLTIY